MGFLRIPIEIILSWAIVNISLWEFVFYTIVIIHSVRTHMCTIKMAEGFLGIKASDQFVDSKRHWHRHESPAERRECATKDPNVWKWKITNSEFRKLTLVPGTYRAYWYHRWCNYYIHYLCWYWTSDIIADLADTALNTGVQMQTWGIIRTFWFQAGSPIYDFCRVVWCWLKTPL